MSRPLRIELAGGLYHVTSRGNERKAIFLDATDRLSFLDLVALVCERYRWRCLTWCLMDNHYHLVLQTIRPTLSRGMRQLNGAHAQRFNRRYGRIGHLFQGRFKASLIEGDPHLLEVIRYTLLNPVRAGAIEDPSSWPWSSYPATVGTVSTPSFLARDIVLGLFAAETAEAIPRFERFLADGAGSHSADVAPSPASGSRAFVAARLCELTETPSAETPRLERVAAEAIRLHRPWSDEAFHAVFARGLSMREVASLAGCHYSTVSRRVARYERSLRAVACKT
ncbi:MAG: transposase [Gaiellaceae bacterium]